MADIVFSIAKRLINNIRSRINASEFYQASRARRSPMISKKTFLIMLLFLIACSPLTEVQVTSGHVVTSWHAYNGNHHHGYNPNEAGELGKFFLQHTRQEVGYPWTSSPAENLFPYPSGKHDGFVILHETDTGCTMFSNFPSGNCIKEYLLEVHTRGNAETMLTRFHSDAGAFKICTGAEGAEPCGFVFTGGITDYGVFHNLYKTELCRLKSDPENYPYEELFNGRQQGIHQPPYRAETNSGAQFWSSLGPNPNWSKYGYYPEETNNVLQLAWNTVDPVNLIPDDQEICGDAGNAISKDGKNAQFQVFTIVLQNLPVKRPFFGFTDKNGSIDESCVEASSSCIPLVIQENVPLGKPILNRRVRQGNPDYAPIQNYVPQ